MTQSGWRTEQLRRLRKAAEQKINNRIVKLRSKPGMKADRLVEELQVYEIELEMQNEQLRVAQVELDQLRQKYFDLFNLAPLGYVTLDEKGLIVDVNIACTRLLGVHKRSLMGKTFSRFISKDSQDDYYLCRKKLLGDRTRQTCEFKLRRKDGSKFHGQLILTISGLEPGGSHELRVIIMDISERKEAQQKSRDYQAKLKAMAAEILLAEDRERHRVAIRFHDNVSQKLAHTKLVLESSLDSVSDPKTLASLRRACDMMGQMIEEAEAFTYELSDPILHELGLVAALDRYLVEEIQRKHRIACAFQSSKAPDNLTSELDSCLFRIARELLNNVVKHANAHKISVSLHGDSAQMRLRVEDDGVGFNVSQLDSGPAGAERFGLFSIREQLDRLEGHLAIESEPGRGTVATVIVPTPENRVG